MHLRHRWPSLLNLHACRSIYIITNLKTKKWSEEATPEAGESHRPPDLRGGAHYSSSLVGGSGLRMPPASHSCLCSWGELCTSTSSLAGSLSLVFPVAWGRKALASGISTLKLQSPHPHRVQYSLVSMPTSFSAVFKHTCSFTNLTPAQSSTSNFYCPFLPGDRLAAV